MHPHAQRASWKKRMMRLVLLVMYCEYLMYFFDDCFQTLQPSVSESFTFFGSHAGGPSRDSGTCHVLFLPRPQRQVFVFLYFSCLVSSRLHQKHHVIDLKKESASCTSGRKSVEKREMESLETRLTPQKERIGDHSMLKIMEESNSQKETLH